MPCAAPEWRRGSSTGAPPTISMPGAPPRRGYGGNGRGDSRFPLRGSGRTGGWRWRGRAGSDSLDTLDHCVGQPSPMRRKILGTFSIRHPLRNKAQTDIQLRSGRHGFHVSRGPSGRIERTEQLKFRDGANAKKGPVSLPGLFRSRKFYPDRSASRVTFMHPGRERCSAPFIFPKLGGGIL